MKHEHHSHHKMNHKLPSVYVNAVYRSDRILIQVRDAKDMTVELLKDHEKSLHLIIVSADLETFLHVHPIETISGDFEVKVNLPSGRYFLFADISPIKGIYVIEPVLLIVGEETKSIANDFSKLVKSDRSTKEIQGKTVTFQHPKLTAGKSATLSFDLNGESPLLYLGALGHVVVLNEQGKRFLHVHPSSKAHPLFQVQFPSGGFYKLWAEFHFAETGVLAFPFLVEVTEPGSP